MTVRPCIPNFLPNFRVGFRDGTNIRETERVRKKLEKLVPTLIFGISVFPKLAKTKISAKSHFRTRNYQSLVKSSEKLEKLVPTLIFESKMVKNGPFWSFFDSKLLNFLPNFFRENYRLSVKGSNIRLVSKFRYLGISETRENE